MQLSALFDELPRCINAGRPALDRKACATLLGWTEREVYTAIDNLRRAHERQPGSTLTLAQYAEMLKAAGLRPGDVGLKRGKWQLARYGDKGGYDLGNCRFVRWIENHAERTHEHMSRAEVRQAISDKALARVRNRCERCGGSYTPGMFARWHGEKCNRQ